MSRLLAVLLVAFSLDAAAQCPTRFASPSSYTHGTILTVGDFDGDRNPDTVTALPHESAIRVNLGSNAGTFRGGAKIEVASQLEREPVRLEATAADVNGDRRLDLVLLNGSTAAIELLLGNGDGTFQPSKVLDYLTWPHGIVTADFDGDGHLDIAAGDAFPGQSAGVMFGDGNGSFTRFLTWTTADAVSGVLAADFDENGRAELVVAQTWGVLDVYTFTANRTVGTPLRLQTASDSYGWLADDVDEDGHLDLAVADLSAFVVGVFRGKGDGTFQPREDWQAGEATEDLVLADVTGDGVRDFIVGNGPSGFIAVLPGRGNGIFDFPIRFTAGFNLYGVEALDVNRDGLVDVLANDFASYTVLLQQSEGGFAIPETSPPYTGTYGTASADFDHDGFPDIAVPDFYNDFTVIRRGDGAGGVTPALGVVFGKGVASIVAGDVNGDGDADLVAGRAGAIMVALGAGDGSFSTPASYPLQGEDYFLVALGDIDRDGDPDLAASGAARIELLANDGHGTFTPRTTLTTLGRPSAAVLADLDRDGVTDLAYAIWEKIEDQLRADADPVLPSGVLSVRLGNGDWTFDEPRETFAGYHPFDVETGDLDGDHDLDLVVSTFGTEGDVRVFRNQGEGVFAAAAVLPVLGQVLETELHDFDRDGRLDLVASQVGLVHVFHATGNLTYGEPVTFLGGSSTPLSADLGDFDGDGKTDIATTGRFGETTVHHNATGCRRRAVR